MSATGRAFHDSFVSAIDDDLDTPTALRLAREVLRADLPADERRWLILDFDTVLGLDLHRAVVPLAAPGRQEHVTSLPEGAADLLVQRSRARADGDYATADRLRAELAALGVTVIDRADGTAEAHLAEP